MDAVARRQVCDRLGVPHQGKPPEQDERVLDAVGGDEKQLLSALEHDDLVAMLRTWWYWIDDMRAHVVGVRDASTSDLRTAAARLFVDSWEPSRKRPRDIPGTALRLCWYELGAAHAGEFEDDDGPFEGPTDEFLDDAVYTIVNPDVLEGHERTGVEFEEGRPWVAGARFFARAQEERRRLALVLADALGTGRLIGWTYIRSLTVTTKTVCQTGPVVRLRRGRFDSIRKHSDGTPLSFDYIRPYMPCHLPSFVLRTAHRLHELSGASVQESPVPVSPMVESIEPVITAPRPAEASPPSVAAGLDKQIVAFSWGYEGWGSHTKELVEAVDAVEAERGFGPPLFVDVRFRRQVRAVGFREKAFENLLGPERHVWLQGLGNRAIADRSLGRLLIDDPGEAKTLLGLIAQRAVRRQRVIFFCSCGSPLGRAECHRGAVTKLLAAQARKQATALAIHEWPGGSPMIAGIDVSHDIMRRLRSLENAEDGTRMRVPVPEGVAISRAAALPHLSLLRCRAGDDEIVAISGAATCTVHGWMFPVYGAHTAGDVTALCKQQDRDLAKKQLNAIGAELPVPMRWRVDDHWLEPGLRHSD